MRRQALAAVVGHVGALRLRDEVQALKRNARQRRLPAPVMEALKTAHVPAVVALLRRTLAHTRYPTPSAGLRSLLVYRHSAEQSRPRLGTAGLR